VVHFGYMPASVEEVYFPQCEVIGDIGAGLLRLADRLEGKLHLDSALFMRMRESILARVAEGSNDTRFPPIPQRLVRDVRQALPEDGIVALDNGMYKIWFARYYRAHEPNSLLLDNALASMGAGLPSAIATKIVHPDRKVMAVCGDGGFMMNSQELETAVRLKLDLVILIVRDDAFGMIRWKQENMNFPDYGMTLSNPDFVAYAESYGAKGHRIESAAEFAPLLRECFATPGVHVIDLPIDYSDNERVLNREIKRLSAQL
jgi:acetolactate synthase-1/2/3 large subunit